MSARCYFGAVGGRYDQLIVTGLTARAPAKLNLQLSVGPLRPDGFHDVVTVYHAVSLFDEVTVSPSSRISVQVEGEGAKQVPVGRGNLAAQAAMALRRATGISGGAKIVIRKKIAVAGGLAGGSADAAATLVACNSLWAAGLSGTDLFELAAGVGSDVSFSLCGGTAIGIGRGEQLSPALVSGRYHWVLAFADAGLATAAVYAECDRLRALRMEREGPNSADRPNLRGANAVSSALLAALRAGDAAAVGRLLSNDLEPAALSLQPGLRRVLRVGREHGALGSIVSGSGPTCAFLASGREHALDLAAALTGAGVCRNVTAVHGPVAGAVVTPQPSGRPSRI